MLASQKVLLFVIHQQFNHEPEDGDVFVVLSKDQCKVRLFNYDRRSYTLYEKCFTSGYRFMKVEYKDASPVYSIDWKDVVLLIESPVAKTFVKERNLPDKGTETSSVREQ